MRFALIAGLFLLWAIPAFAQEIPTSVVIPTSEPGAVGPTSAGGAGAPELDPALMTGVITGLSGIYAISRRKRAQKR